MTAREPRDVPLVSLTCKRISVSLGRDDEGLPWLREHAAGELIHTERLDAAFLGAWGTGRIEAVGGELPPDAATVELSDRFGRTQEIPVTDRLWLSAAPSHHRRPVHVIYKDQAGGVLRAEILLRRSSRIHALYELTLRSRPVRARGTYTYRSGRRGP